MPKFFRDVPKKEELNVLGEFGFSAQTRRSGKYTGSTKDEDTRHKGEVFTGTRKYNSSGREKGSK